MTRDDDASTIVTTRVIDAPREKIFRAYENIEHLARWWGPNGFTQTVERFEFRPGGTWKFMFHGPDGTNWPNESVWREIERPARVVLEHLEPHFVLTMTLDEAEGGKTRLTWRQRFDTPQIRERFDAICVPANEQNFDRLEAELARMN